MFDIEIPHEAVAQARKTGCKSQAVNFR